MAGLPDTATLWQPGILGAQRPILSGSRWLRGPATSFSYCLRLSA